MRSLVHGRMELTAPWGMDITLREDPLFYVVTRGNCVLEIDGSQLALSGGDFVFIPSGRSFTLKDSASTRAESAADVYARRGERCGGILRYGGGGTPTTIVAGRYVFEGATLSPLVKSLPPLLHVKGDGGGAAGWLASTMQFVASELEAEAPGYETVASRLGDVLFVHALRAHLATLPEGKGGWLRALVDARIGPVLQRVHEAPEKPWTLESLARASGMSRSVFAARFKELVGEAPLKYLTQWRMHRASELVASGTESMGAIAQAVGYETESAFGKAFRRYVGETPGAFRRRLAQRGPRQASGSA
jgi:AraC-like DNA-binding protein